MDKRHDHFQDHLEWETLDKSGEISNLNFETGLYQLDNNCVIRYSRDKEYGLIASIFGQIEKPDQLEPQVEQVKGAFVEGETIVGYSPDGQYEYKLFDAVIGAYTSSMSSFDPPSMTFEAELFIHSIKRKSLWDQSSLENLHEWYISGPCNVSFPRATSRSIGKSYIRCREGIDPEDKENLIKSSGTGRDFLFVKTDSFSFIVSRVPETYGPGWSSCFSIEYRKSFGTLPNEIEREAISEIVSFVFGNHLLKIGSTGLTRTYSVIEQEYQTPWGDNVISRCKKIGTPPVHIDSYKDLQRSENLLNHLVPTYLKKRAELKLKDTLWKYWLAKYSPLGTNLPILSSAIETLAGKILKSHPEVKSHYIPFKEFTELIKDELQSISKKLTEVPEKEIIINKLKASSLRGGNEKLNLMFELIYLPVGTTERNAIKARNKMAHSSMGEVDDEEIKNTLRMTRAYETLFHRTLLKCLSHKGTYIDYCTFGHPNRHIDDPIPELSPPTKN